MTTKVHNFAAGPSILPPEVIEETVKAVQNFTQGLSVMEISHRNKEWENVMEETRQLWRELLKIPENYEVLFLGGGASTQFGMIPMNLLNKKAAYFDTGVWASKAIKDAKLFGEVEIIASSKDKNYSYIPKNYTIPTDVDYLHITTNNTIYGTEIHTDIDSPVNLIADMSSDILSRPVDVSKYAMIYGGAQKNVGPAGVTFVIMRNDLLGKVGDRKIPAMMDYKNHITGKSMYNTPPVISIYVMNRVLHWIKKQGGVEVLQKRNEEKAKLLYDEIERNKLFKPCVEKEDRSLMNITFVMNEEYKDKENEFFEFAKSKGMMNIKGHRSVGGFRASTYNALPIESVKALVECMQEFEKKF